MGTHTTTVVNRRQFLSTALGAAWGTTACQPRNDTAHISGGFTGIDHVRGHWLRDAVSHTPHTQALPSPARTRQTEVVIAGAGVAGLAAARALRLQGRDDFAVLELEDTAGGNSRAGHVAGFACPLGAHYLPLPSDAAPEVQDLLEEWGLRQRVAGRWQYDERHLCHNPQERLFFNGEWQDGLLPTQGVDASTLEQYRSFAALVEASRKTGVWGIPVPNKPLSPEQQAQAAITFAAYLDQHGLTDAHLRWYLDYCCRDDYGAGIARVSAWAGIHYFASRHGFHAPGMETAEREGLLTWPEGNAWLTQRLIAPLGERLHTGCVVLRIAHNKHAVTIDAFNHHTRQVERWQARSAVVALPLFLAARVVQDPPDFLRLAAQRVVYAPWLVANIHLASALHDRPGPAPCWDNVLYGSFGLGYVDAMHQSLQTVPGATVLTHYRALGDVPDGRRQLQEQDWRVWRDTIIAELSVAHPDLARRATHMALTRYGHAMAIPVPQKNGHIGLQPPWNERKKLSKSMHHPKRSIPAWGRLHFAHSDWAGYSVFEEAFTAGHTAGYGCCGA